MTVQPLKGLLKKRKTLKIETKKSQTLDDVPINYAIRKFKFLEIRQKFTAGIAGFEQRLFKDTNGAPHPRVHQKHPIKLAASKIHSAFTATLPEPAYGGHYWQLIAKN